jgi:hypothetical protein
MRMRLTPTPIEMDLLGLSDVGVIPSWGTD